MIKDQELQKLILRALKWNEPGKTIESQLDRLKNASFRGVLNNPDLLRDEDLVQLLGPYLDHGSFAPLDTSRLSNVDYTKPMMDNQNVTEMEVGVDPDLFFPYDDDESKGIDIEVTKVVKPKKERKKSEPRNRSPNKKTSTAGSSSSTVSSIIAPTSPPPKIRIKAEGLFKTAFSHSSISKSTVPMPKPVIVVPPPKIVQKSNAQPTLPKPKIIDEVPSIQTASETKIATNASTVAVVDKPVKVSPSAKKPLVSEKAEPTPLPIVSKEEAAPDVQSTEKEKEKEKGKDKENKKEEEEDTPSTTKNSKIETTTTTSSRASPKVTAASKVEPKRSQPRKVKIDQSGPKTRARSIFGTRHKCAVCSKKFSTSGNLKAHVKTHKPKGKFNCDKCGRV